MVSSVVGQAVHVFSRSSEASLDPKEALEAASLFCAASEETIAELIGGNCLDAKAFGELMGKLAPQSPAEETILETLKGICPQHGKTVSRKTLGHALKTNNQLPTAKFDRFLKSLGIPEEQEIIDVEVLAKALVKEPIRV